MDDSEALLWIGQDVRGESSITSGNENFQLSIRGNAMGLGRIFYYGYFRIDANPDYGSIRGNTGTTFIGICNDQ